jgi:hypothetical protein
MHLDVIKIFAQDFNIYSKSEKVMLVLGVLLRPTKCGAIDRHRDFYIQYSPKKTIYPGKQCSPSSTQEGNNQ